MAFPDDILDIKVELRYSDTWNDITSYVRAESGIEIRRGRTDRDFDLDPSSCKLTLDNTDGRFSSRNPSSPLFGLTGRNTPLRVSVPATAKYLWSPGSPGDRYNAIDPDGVEEVYVAAASAPDASALGITGDLDVRVDADMYWRPDWTTLASKYETTSDERSWALSVYPTGALVLEWTTDGTSGTRTQILSTEPVGKIKGRLAVRATLDVDNGASGNTVTFYTSDSLSGSWTQLGDAVVTSGTTSVYDSTAAVEVAGGYERQLTQPRGRFYGFELRSGIGGTVVANPDFTAQTVGATSFADTASSANTWVVGSSSRIDDRDYRFHGEVASWPQRWDTTGRDVTVEITAYGILRRLRHNEKALKSAMYRAVTADPTTVAYWPLEEPDGAAYFASPLEGCPPMSFSRGADTKPDLAAFDGFGGSEQVPEFEDTYFIATVPPYRLESGGASELRFLFNTEHDPALERIATVRTSGTAVSWRMFYDATGNIQVTVHDEDGTQIEDSGVHNFNIDNRPVQIGLRIGQDGSDVAYAIFVGDASTGFFTRVAESTVGVISSRTAGIITEIDFNAGGGLGDGLDRAAIGHVAIHRDQVFTTNIGDDIYNTRVISAPPHGWKAEATGRRFRRLCFEQGVPHSVFGSSDVCITMSTQRAEPLTALLAECADAEDGLLVEPRDALEMAFRTRDTMINQAAALTLDYSSAELAGALEPVEDDDDSFNDITAKSTNGSYARATQLQGRMSVQDPPDGIGQYETEIEVSAEFAEQMPNYAHWALRLGTLDAPRYPSVSVDLARSATSAMADEVRGVDLGDSIHIENLPDWLPPEDVKLRVQGVNESLNAYQHYFTFDCSPDVYDCAVVGTDRYDSDWTYLRGPVDDDDTSLEIVVRKGPLWDSDTYDIAVGGEEMTVSAVAGSAAHGIDVRATFDTVDTIWISDSGHDWDATGGVADYSQNGAYGTALQDTVNTNQYAHVPQAHTDIDFRLRFSLAELPEGDDVHLSLLGRYTDTSNYVEARAEVATTGAVTLSIEENVAGSVSNLDAATSTGVTLTAGDWVWVRLRLIGADVMAKAWADGDDEPAAWTCTATDAAVLTGTHLAVHTFLGASTSNTPFEFRVDDLDAATPQTMTVTRSVNGVVKAQVPDQQLHLATRPFRNFDRLPFLNDEVDWFTGEILGNLRSPRTVQAESGVDVLNIAVTTPAINSAAPVGARFMAPLTGRVLMTLGGIARDNTNDNRAFLMPDIWFVKDADNTWFSFLDGTSESVHQYGLILDGEASDPAGMSRTVLIDGLQPGRVYFAQVLTAADTTTSASTDVFYRSITVEPAP